MCLATAARLVIYNKASLAEKLIRKSETIARHVAVSSGRVSFCNHQLFESEFALEKARCCEDELKVINDIIYLEGPGDPMLPKRASKLEENSKLWRKGIRKITLDALELSDVSIVSKPEEITESMAEAWQPIFQKKGNHHKMQLGFNYFKKFVPNLSGQWCSIPPPFANEFCSYAIHCKPSFPGEDCRPYSAWGTESGGETLQGCFFMSASGIVFESRWNNQVMVFAPKGQRDSDSKGTTIRSALENRPLVLKSSDNKICAGVGNSKFQNITKKNVHRWQRGFVGSRNFIENVVTIDTVGRKISFKDLSKLCPVFASFDFESAFPSLLHDFILWYLQATGAPTWIFDWINSFYTWCLSYVRGVNGLMFFLRMLSATIQGCPLSGTLFAHCSHPLLAAIEDALEHASQAQLINIISRAQPCSGLC